MREDIEDGVELIGYITWGCIDLVSASTGEMSKRYEFIFAHKQDDGILKDLSLWGWVLFGLMQF